MHLKMLSNTYKATLKANTFVHKTCRNKNFVNILVYEHVAVKQHAGCMKAAVKWAFQKPMHKKWLTSGVYLDISYRSHH
jgi:hypothetical protein